MSDTIKKETRCPTCGQRAHIDSVNRSEVLHYVHDERNAALEEAAKHAEWYPRQPFHSPPEDSYEKIEGFCEASRRIAAGIRALKKEATNG